MVKSRRSGFVFVSWRGDHVPRHVHVYRDGEQIGKWDLDNGKLMWGRLPGRVIRIIRALCREGRL